MLYTKRTVSSVGFQGCVISNPFMEGKKSFFIVSLARMSGKSRMTTSPPFDACLLAVCGATFKAQLKLSWQLGHFRPTTAQNRFQADVAHKKWSYYQKPSSLALSSTAWVTQDPHIRFYPYIILWSIPEAERLCLFKTILPPLTVILSPPILIHTLSLDSSGTLPPIFSIL